MLAIVGVDILAARRSDRAEAGVHVVTPRMLLSCHAPPE